MLSKAHFCWYTQHAQLQTMCTIKARLGCTGCVSRAPTNIYIYMMVGIKFFFCRSPFVVKAPGHLYLHEAFFYLYEKSTARRDPAVSPIKFYLTFLVGKASIRSNLSSHFFFYCARCFLYILFGAILKKGKSNTMLDILCCVSGVALRGHDV